MAKASDKTVNASPIKNDAIEIMGATFAASDFLDQLNEAKPEDFVKVEDDVWKGDKVGDVMLGILVGKSDSNFENASWWHFATKSILDGSIVEKRVLGTTIIERAMKTLAPGTLVEIEFRGTQPSREGNDLQLYTVRIPKKK